MIFIVFETMDNKRKRRQSAKRKTENSLQHFYEVRPRRDRRGFDLISDALPFGRLWYGRVTDAIGYAKFYSRSHAMIVRVFDESGALIETHEPEGDFREP